MTPEKASVSRANPVRLIQNPQFLTTVVVVLSISMCAAITLLHLHQKKTLDHLFNLHENLRLARINLSEGFLHVSLGNTANSPYDQQNGYVLLQQALDSFDEIRVELNASASVHLHEFQNSLSIFNQCLEKLRKIPQPEASLMTELRIAFNDIEVQARHLDDSVRREFLDLSASYDAEFLVMLCLSAFLLTGICIVVFIMMRAKRAADNTLRERTLRLQLTVESGHIGLWDWDLVTNAVTFSPEWKRQIGYEDDEIPNRYEEWESRVHPDDLEFCLNTLHESLAGNVPSFSIEFRFRHKDGSYRWILTQASLVRNADGKPVRLMGSHVDITGMRQAEENLRRQEMLLMEAGEIAHVGGWEFDPVTLEGTWTEETMRIHDVDPVLKATAPLGLSFYHGDSLLRIETAVQEAITSGKSYDLELELTTAKGNHKWVRTICHPIVEKGKVIRVRGSIQDITERKLAEIEQERLATAIEQAGEAVIITSLDGTILYVNPAFEKSTGFTRSEALGQNPRILKSGAHDTSFYKDLWSTISEKGIWRGQIINKRKDETLFTEEATISPICDTTGATIGYVAVGRDISDQIRLKEEKEELQDQLLQSQKMEAVGRLAGGVAHDFNNMLQTILGFADIALRESKSNPLLQECVQEIKNAGLRSADLTRQLLAFARRQTVNPQVLDLNDSVAGMLKMLQRLIGEDINLAWLPGPALWPVRMDPSQIDQILANLAVNARDAIHGVGKVTIETENVVIDTSYCLSHADSVPGAFVSLAVSDDGHGIDPEILTHIFEPFFTTKGIGEGTGLGLATVYGVVRQNNGFINVYSETGTGTTFRIYLPRFDSVDLEKQTKEVPEPIPQGNETILIVEDEEKVLTLAVRFLEELGYTVLSEKNPIKALELARQTEGIIHLLVTDVVMPEMNGRELSARMRALRPDLQTVFMSGYTANVIAHRGVLDEGAFFVQKPFSQEMLARIVRQALDGKPFPYRES